MESRRERLRSANVRRRPREVSAGAGPPPSDFERRRNQKFFYVAAGAVVLALVAFVCGVQMGVTLSDLGPADAPPSRIEDRKGEPPPFRIMEKEPAPEAKPAPPSRETAEAPKEGPPARPAPKAPPGKQAGAAKDPSAAASSAEGETAAAKARYSLQVAAYNNLQEAQELMSQLKKKGYEAYLVTGSGAAKGTLHRVRIGHFQTLPEARQFALSFEKRENLKPIIASLQNP